MPAANVSAKSEAEFRAEVREFVAAELPADIRHKTGNGLLLEKDDYVRWQKILYNKGWFAPAWPREFGGGGWSLTHRYILSEETVGNGAPAIIPFGVNMVGPVLYTFGNEEQKARHLPGILNSDTWWCQGYSEPNAGSDLASLTTSATRDGDTYVINGAKTWTTEAQYADMMHCLVRTDRSGRKQEGITFLMIDMNSPGLRVEPIYMLDGVRHVNMVFFDNVRVPVENRIGEEGDGWKIAKFLLSHERSFIDRHQYRAFMLRQLRIAARQVAALDPLPLDVPLLMTRLARQEAEFTAAVALERNYVADWAAGRDDGIGPSILKIVASEQLQQLAELWRDLLGPYADCYDVADLHGSAGVESNSPWIAASPANFLYLFGRCYSIFGGSNEIQRNLIAGQSLALKKS